MKKTLFYLGIVCLFLTSTNFTFAQEIVFDWMTHVAGEQTNVACGDVYMNRTLAVDRDGYVYNIGMINSGEPDFDLKNNGRKLNMADGKHYITKYDSAQNLIWAKQYGSIESWTKTTSIAVDTLGNIYLAGYFENTFDMDPGPNVQSITSNGSSDMFVIKLNKDGEFIWGKQIGDFGYDQIHALALDPSGNIYYTGNFGGTVDFSPGSSNSTLTGGGSFVLKLNTDGSFGWVKGLFGAITGRSIILDDMQNVLVTGDFSNRVDFNPSTQVQDSFFLTSAGNTDIFVLKLDKDGDFVWARNFGGKSQDQGFSIGVDEAGAVYTTGIFSDTADFNPWGSSYTMISAGAQFDMEIFISKIDANGNFRWARQVNGESSNWGYSIDVGRGKGLGVYGTGVFRGTADFYQKEDTIQLTAVTGTEGYLIKLDTAGEFEWSKQIGGNSSGTVVVDEKGSVYAAGYFTAATVDFNPDEDNYMVNKIGTLDGFILKLRRCELSDTIVQEACKSFEFMGTVYTNSGLYTVANPEGCDSESVFVLDLNIYGLDPVINVEGFRLGTTQAFDAYQWLLNGAIIPGATERTYDVVENGDYQVVVTDNDLTCTDTSAIYTISNVGINDINGYGKSIRIYPNPTDDIINIDASIPVNVTLSGIDGRRILSVNDAKKISLKELATGMYFANFYDEEGRLIRVSKIMRK